MKQFPINHLYSPCGSKIYFDVVKPMAGIYVKTIYRENRFVIFIDYVHTILYTNFIYI